MLYSDEFSTFDLGISYVPHMTVGKLKTVDELDRAYDAVKDRKTIFKSTVTKISVEMIACIKEKHIYMVSVIFEEELKSFYEKFGFYTMLSGQLETYKCK